MGTTLTPLCLQDKKEEQIKAGTYDRKFKLAY
jgi:hypothetical protein